MYGIICLPLVVGAPQVPVQIRLPLPVLIVAGFHITFDNDVRNNALGLDRFSRRAVIAGCCQLDAAAVAQWQHGLYRPFAKCALSDDQGPAVVLQRARQEDTA